MKGIKFQFQSLNNKIQQLLIKADSPKTFIFSLKKIVLQMLNAFHVLIQETQLDTTISQAFKELQEKMKKAVHLHNINAFGQQSQDDQFQYRSNHNFQIDQISVFLNSRKPIESNQQGRGQFYKFLSQAQNREKDLQQILANYNKPPTGNLKNTKLSICKNGKNKSKFRPSLQYQSKQTQTDINGQKFQSLINQKNRQEKQTLDVPKEDQISKSSQKIDVNLNIIRNQTETSKKDLSKSIKKQKSNTKSIDAKNKNKQNVDNKKSNSITNQTRNEGFNKYKKDKNDNKQRTNQKSDDKNQISHKKQDSNFKNAKQRNQMLIIKQENNIDAIIKALTKDQQMQTQPLKQLGNLADRFKNKQKSASYRQGKSFSEISNSYNENTHQSKFNNSDKNEIKQIQSELMRKHNKTGKYGQSLQIYDGIIDKINYKFNKNSDQAQIFYKNSQKVRPNQKLPTLSTYQMRNHYIKKGNIKKNNEQQHLMVLQQSKNKNHTENQQTKINQDNKGVLKNHSGLLPSLNHLNSPGIKSSDRNKVLNTKINFTSIHEKNKKKQQNEKQNLNGGCNQDKLNLNNEKQNKGLHKKMQERQKRMMKQIQQLVSDNNSNKNKRKIQMYIQFIQAIHQRQCGKSCIHLARFYQFLKKNNVPHRKQVIMHRKNINFQQQINRC